MKHYHIHILVDLVVDTKEEVDRIEKAYQNHCQKLVEQGAYGIVAMKSEECGGPKHEPSISKELN